MMMPSLKSVTKRLFGTNRKIGTVISFPKSGRTWLRVMLDNLEIKLKYTHAGTEYGTHCHFIDLPEPRAVKTEGKLLFLLRDPRDTAVSSYFEKSKRKNNVADHSDISDFIRDPRYGIEKIVCFNTAWLNEKNYADFRHYKAISYEALRGDPVAGLAALYTYLKGWPPRQQDLIRQVVEESSFARMQARERSGELAAKYGSILRPGDFNDPESFKVRKGKVGGFTDYLNAADIDFCNNIMVQYQYDAAIGNGAGIMLIQPA
jgi:hypothetical protein